ncbi:MAG: chromosome segregation SMC family protein, partial [Planctomycetota bacterium]
MKLKKLILQGFKSFADRTEFEIPDGITVIVGPNGCGKSNLVDAVKWVMGDQRPSSLRAKEMQDVIFSGTDSRRGMGFAEVSLVLDNPDRELPIDYEEVVLTRRLYRSGESEYQINGNSVRLRDVRELMMDAGGGLGSFSVIEQGNIDFLLRADPQERRVIFEEAAGIAKYRARRREAARKRERTAENLERLRGLISETETRERSLKIQAGKARRYREFTDELKRKRVTGALARYAELARRRDTADEELQAIARAEKEAREQLEQAMRATEDERRRLDALRRAVAEREAEIAGLMGEESAAEEKRAARLREADELALRADRAAGEAEEVHARSAASRSDLEEASGALARAERERDGVNEALRSAEQNLAVLGERARELTEQLEELDRRRAQSLSEETAARNEEITYEAEQRSLQSRLDRLGEKEISSQRALAEAKAARDEARLRLRKTEEELRSLEARHTAAEEEVRNAHDQKDAARESAAAATQLTAALDARREVLTRLVAEGEGLGPGARALLAAARAGALKGVRGLVADLVGDAGEQALTLDQALGDLAGAVVVETVDDARNALRWLQEGRRGRARILPLDRVPVPSTRDLPLPLDGLEPEARRIVGALLRGTTVVDTLQDALALEQEPGRRVVARSGEVVEACGALIGGSGEAGAGH